MHEPRVVKSGHRNFAALVHGMSMFGDEEHGTVRKIPLRFRSNSLVKASDTPMTGHDLSCAALTTHYP